MVTRPSSPDGVSNVPQSETVHVELDPAAVLAAYARHRIRFAQEMSSLDDKALATQSRCTKWSVADVLRHLNDVESWMRTIWAHEPAPFKTFDPNTTPHEYVLAGRAVPDAQVRDEYVASAERMAGDVGGSAETRWGDRSVSPIGFVPWWLSALHIFYDSWLHERDVLLPLGIAPQNQHDEATQVLTYSLALTGTLVRKPLDTVVGGVHIVAGQPPVVATPVTRDASADVPRIIDALNGRDSLEEALAGTDRDLAHELGGLSRFFLAAV